MDVESNEGITRNSPGHSLNGSAQAGSLAGIRGHALLAHGRARPRLVLRTRLVDQLRVELSRPRGRHLYPLQRVHAWVMLILNLRRWRRRGRGRGWGAHAGCRARVSRRRMPGRTEKVKANENFQLCVSKQRRFCCNNSRDVVPLSHTLKGTDMGGGDPLGRREQLFYGTGDPLRRRLVLLSW